MSKEFKIYTKTGDDGTSGLIGGTRVSKWDNRLEAYGTVDELNSWIGMIKTLQPDEQISSTLDMIQNKLFVIGSHLATDTEKSDIQQQLACDGNDILLLEEEIDRMQQIMPPLTHFILPGGSDIAAKSHIARTVCRRAERRITHVVGDTKIQNEIIIFINRLSDYLFVLARFFNYQNGHSETIWPGVKR